MDFVYFNESYLLQCSSNFLIYMKLFLTAYFLPSEDMMNYAFL